MAGDGGRERRRARRRAAGTGVGDVRSGRRRRTRRRDAGRRAQRAAEADAAMRRGGVGDEAGGEERWRRRGRPRAEDSGEGSARGDGGDARVYKATLSDGQVVAIKRAQKGSMQGALEFKTEIELLSRVHHKNLEGLVGFCHDKEEQMLVYEYVSNGTLRENLTGKTGNRLDWSGRLKIALGSARGLAYLHHLADPPIIHRDIKSVNILLDDNLTAKVADFGLSKQVSDAGKGQVSDHVKGTLGYLDPEYCTTQVLTDKSDVYSFGVVMLELITSTPPITQDKKYLVKEIRAALKWEDKLHCGLSDLIDPFLVSKEQLMGFSKFLDLALRCVQESSLQRPTMNEVVKEIEALLEDASDGSSALSLATDFGKSDAAPHQLYDSMLPSGSIKSSSFSNSMSYNFQSRIVPK